MKKEKINLYIRTTALLLILPLSIYLIVISFDRKDGELLNYEEKSTVDYKVCLKENEFFEEECQDKGMGYIASAINYIDVDFDYKLLTNNLVNFNYNYYIEGIVKVIDANDKSNILFTKKVEILEKQTGIDSNRELNRIIKNVKIDYEEYNNLVKSFKNTYNVPIESNLKLTLYVSNDIMHTKTNKEIKTNNKIELTIPLTEKTIKVTMDSKEGTEKQEILLSDETLKIDEKKMSLGILSSIISIILLGSIVKTILKLENEKTEYEKYVSNKLKNYNRMIVSAKANVKLEEKDYEEIIDVTTFEELVDVADRLMKLIVWTEVKHKNKLIVSWFTVEDGRRLYRIIYKSSDKEFK
jgi:hypothetical protein